MSSSLTSILHIAALPGTPLPGIPLPGIPLPGTPGGFAAGFEQVLNNNNDDNNNDNPRLAVSI